MPSQQTVDDQKVGAYFRRYTIEYNSDPNMPAQDKDIKKRHEEDDQQQCTAKFLSEPPRPIEKISRNCRSWYTKGHS